MVFGAFRHFGTRLCRREPWGAGIFNGPAHYSSFVRFPSSPPACAVFYMGGTDLQESNVTDLKPDYSDFLLVKLRNMATVHFLIQRRWALFALLSELDHRTFVPPGRVSRIYDQRFSRI